MSIKSRQVAGVTTLVMLIVSALSAYHLATLARISMQETASRGDQQFGTIRIGISTLLVKSELQSAFRLALQSVLVALGLSTIVAMLLAQWMLRPIHVIQSGLTRLGQGELDVRLELKEEEFKDL